MMRGMRDERFFEPEHAQNIDLEGLMIARAL